MLPLSIRPIGFIYIVQSELSSNLCTNYPVTKHYLVTFFVKKTNSCQFQNNKWFCISSKKSLGEFSCPYKSAILWRHIFYWHEIGARHSIPTKSMVYIQEYRKWRILRNHTLQLTIKHRTFHYKTGLYSMPSNCTQINKTIYRKGFVRANSRLTSDFFS